MMGNRTGPKTWAFYQPLLLGEVALERHTRAEVSSMMPVRHFPVLGGLVRSLAFLPSPYRCVHVDEASSKQGAYAS